MLCYVKVIKQLDMQDIEEQMEAERAQAAEAGLEEPSMPASAGLAEEKEAKRNKFRAMRDQV